MLVSHDNTMKKQDPSVGKESVNVAYFCCQPGKLASTFPMGGTWLSTWKIQVFFLA